MRSQDFRDNRAGDLHQQEWVRPRLLLTEECHNTARDPQGQTNLRDLRDRKLRRWTRTTPLTLKMRPLHLNQKLKRHHQQRKVLAKVRQVPKKCHKRNLLERVLKTHNKAKLKGLIQNVSKLRLS